MQKDSTYDSTLQMYIVPPQDPNWSHLCFLRALAEHGLLEHHVVGDPSGVALEGRTDGDVKQLLRARLGVAVYTVPLLVHEF